MGKQKQAKKASIGHTNFATNQIRRKAKQEKYLEKAEKKKLERLDMLEKVQLKFRGKSLHWLRKKFGVLNISRMKTLLNGTWESCAWYLNREALKEAELASKLVIHQKNNNDNSNHSKKRNKFHKNYAKKAAKQESIPEVSTGSTERTKQT